MKNKTFKNGVMGGVLALALIASASPASRVEAATLGELQAQIQSLLAQIQTLQKQTGNTSQSCVQLTNNNMTLGSKGGDVTALQNFLISKSITIPAGATGYFGGQTQSALAQFQAQNGISPAVGYFGPLTRAKISTMCTAQPQTPTIPTTPTTPTTPTVPTTPTAPTLRGEASFNKFDTQSGDDTNLQEGQSNASVMDVEFEVEDGDAVVNRVDVGFTPDVNNEEKKPWKTFKEVSIYDGGTRLAKLDTSSKSAWKEDSPSSGSYTLRLSGINWTVNKNDTAQLSVRVTTVSKIDGTSDGEVWSVFIPNNGIRALDAAKSSVYTGDTADSVTIDIDEEGSTDEIIIKRSNDDLDATTIQLKDNARSGYTKVFAFDLDTDDSKNDIEITEIPVQFTVSTGTVDTFMRDVRIKVDGKTYTKKTIVDGLTNTITFEFGRGDLVIKNGDRVTAEVEVDFKALATVNEGTTIVGSVMTSGIKAEGADDLAGGQLSGAATGEVHTMRASGAILKLLDTTAVFKANSSATKEDDAGSYSIKFEVTAFDKNIYIAKSSERGLALGSAGVNFIIEDSSLGGTEVASGTVSSILTSNAKSEGSFYRVSQGETKSFTLLVEYNPEYESFYNVQLHSLNWSNTAVAPTVQQFAVPEQNFETVSLSIGN